MLNAGRARHTPSPITCWASTSQRCGEALTSDSRPLPLWMLGSDADRVRVAERVAQLIISEFHVPWLRVQVNKRGALRGAKDVGVIIERGERQNAIVDGSS